MKLEGLNEKQLEAVKTTDGPLLVLAGAGSGKTKVLTTRIAYLIESGVEPYNILAITFTNKAAKEMKERIFKLVGEVKDIQISTFHSFGLYLIKRHYNLLGYERNFTILDGDDSLVLVKNIVKEMGLNSDDYNPKAITATSEDANNSIKAIRNKISGAKNELVDPFEYEKYATTDFEEVVCKVYKKYEERLKSNNSVDFDDLLILPIKLFSTFKDILKMYQERFKYILVDEYQDTNRVQYILVNMLAAKYKNICVVGDNDQAIYSWRGSDYRNILNFENDYPSLKSVMLEENYRSTKTILNAANDVIKNNKIRKDKNLWTKSEEGPKIRYHRASDEKDESYYVVNEIKNLLYDGVKRENIAVLYRTNAQSRNIEEAMLKENIPYKVIGSFYFYNRKEIKDLISYLKLIYNTNDDISLVRIINVPKRGIGDKTISNLSDKSFKLNKSLYDVIDSGKELTFKNTIEELRELSNNVSLTELIDLILDKSGIRKDLESEKSVDAEIRLSNLEEFKSITRTYEEATDSVSLGDFLEEISLVADINEHKNETNVVTLMTIHSAKGLEFDYVFVIGMEEGLFPHLNSMETEDLEEERRLCYVAITRAKKKLWLVNAKRRMIYGKTDSYLPSRFINEISDEYLEKDEVNKVKYENTTTDDYKYGDKVNHKIFGLGVIVGIDERDLTIAFGSKYGIKKIAKGHASLRREEDA